MQIIDDFDKLEWTVVEHSDHVVLSKNIPMNDETLTDVTGYSNFLRLRTSEIDPDP